MKPISVPFKFGKKKSWYFENTNNFPHYELKTERNLSTFE